MEQQENCLCEEGDIITPYCPWCGDKLSDSIYTEIRSYFIEQKKNCYEQVSRAEKSHDRIRGVKYKNRLQRFTRWIKHIDKLIEQDKETRNVIDES